MSVQRLASVTLAIAFLLQACSDDSSEDKVPKPPPAGETGTLQVDASAPGDAKSVSIVLEAERACEAVDPCWDELSSFPLALVGRDDDASTWRASQPLDPGSYRLRAEWESGRYSAQQSPAESFRIEAGQTRQIELILVEDDGGAGGSGGGDGGDGIQDPSFVTVQASEQAPAPGETVEIVVKATDGQKGQAPSFTLSGQSEVPIPLGETECPTGCTPGRFGDEVAFAPPKAGEELRTATIEWTAPPDIGQFQHTLRLRIQTDEDAFAEHELQLTVSPVGGCPPGQVDCDGTCRDLSSDREACGSCDNDCTALPGVDVAAVACNQGSCEYACAIGFADCDESAAGCETNTLDNDDHCGACDAACTGDLYCLGSTCLCPSGLRACPEGGDACTDVNTDVNNCGQCGMNCLALDGILDATCNAGTCELECAENLMNCDGDPLNGCETEVLTDQQHCGACDNACSALEVCEDGVCVGICEEGARCDGVCKDLDTDPEHCGACNNPCDGVCVDGVYQNTVVDIAAMYQHTCAVFSDSTVRCWGSNSTSQLGVDDSSAGALPVQVKDPDDPTGFLTGVVQISAGGDGTSSSAAGDHSCALLKDGTVKCWGSNKNGQLGDGTNTNRWQPKPVLADAGGQPLQDIVEIAAGAGHTCARDAHGVTRCWGKNSNGQIGNLVRNNPTEFKYPEVVQDPDNPGNPLPDVTQLAPGRLYTCLLMKDTTARCWGNSGNQQAGGSITADPTPIPHSTPFLTGIIQVDAETTHCCALLDTGGIKCWGAVQKINGGSGNAANPIEILDDQNNPLTGVASIELGESHTCAVMQDGTARCWGANTSRQLGAGSTSTRIDTPTPVVVDEHGTILEGIEKAALGTGHSCFLTKDGEVYCAGARLRIGTNPEANSPIAVKVSF